MADSIQLYDGYRNISVNKIDILRKPNQKLANAIATGPQDEFFSRLEDCNRLFRNDEDKLSVTPSWNWRAGSLDKIKSYVNNQLMLNKKSNGLSKYLMRTQEHARYKISYLANKLDICERLKRQLKREGYQLNVDIDEYVIMLTSFCDKIESAVKQSFEATNGKVVLVPYIHIPPNNERNTKFYLDCYINEGEMTICQDKTVIQKLPMKGIKLIFDVSLRMMTKYLGKPNPSNYSVQYRGLYDMPMIGTLNYRARQALQHPYIAQPNCQDNGDISWGTACFSNFTDSVRKAFHDLNFVVLAMELLEWSSYYNVSHANPYNQPSMLHFGMSNSYNLTYQSTQNTDTQNCSDRVRGAMQTKSARDFSKQNSRDRIAIVEHCQDISCIWRQDCHLFKSYSTSLKRVADEENVYKYESILGALMEHYDEKTLITTLYEDFGCYLDNSLPETHEIRDMVLYDYEDVLNYIVMSTEDIDYFKYLLVQMYYWGKNKEDKVILVDEDILNKEQIKQEMLQWATERSI